MLIALDYDDTYTRDKVFWDHLISLAIKRGHSVICVTAREERYRAEVDADLGQLVEAILCTGGRAKQSFAMDAGFNVSVWIDDQPGWIVNDAMPVAKRRATW